MRVTRRQLAVNAAGAYLAASGVIRRGRKQGTKQLVFPASYYTGPLGNNNILPATADGYLCGLWSGTSTTAQESRDLIAQRMTDSGRTFDFISGKLTAGDLANGDSYSTGGQKGETWIDSLGSIAVMSWDWNVYPGDVPGGTLDSTLDLVVNRFKAHPARIILRLWREQNIQGSQQYYIGDSDQTSGQLATIAADWIAGWRYVVDYFAAAGATNVGFCWCPSQKGRRTNVSTEGGRDQLLATYPGDAYIDWVGADGYNHSRTGVFSTPTHDGWAEFNEVHNYKIANGYANPSIGDEYGPAKPHIIFETGTKYDSGTSTRKGDWFRHIETVAKDSMPYLHGVQMFDNWVSAESNDWRVDHDQVGGTGLAQGSFNQASYDGWLELVAAARCNVGIA